MAELFKDVTYGHQSKGTVQELEIAQIVLLRAF